MASFKGVPCRDPAIPTAAPLPSADQKLFNQHIDGEGWKGPLALLSSPLLSRQPDGNRPSEIDQFPLLTHSTRDVDGMMSVGRTDGRTDVTFLVVLPFGFLLAQSSNVAQIGRAS